jgi:hypothetical protein
MSVKFAKEIIKEAAVPGGGKQALALEIGERLAGGKGGQTGYLAVRKAWDSNPKTCHAK